MKFCSKFLFQAPPTFHSSSPTLQSDQSNTKSKILKRAAAGSLLPLLLCASGAYSASFEGIGFLEGDSQSRSNAISGDGSTVVGYGSSGSSAKAFYWTSTGGLVALDASSGGIKFANGVNSDGTVIVGADSGFDSFRWTPTGGMQDIGAISGLGGKVTARGVSADGSTVVGQNQFSFGGNVRWDAFRWTTTSAATSLDFLPGVPSNERFANTAAASADGSVVVGDSRSGEGQRAFRWTESGGMVSLGALGGGPTSKAKDVSNDGAIVVGSGFSDLGQEAFLWTEAGGMVGLGDLPGGVHNSEATGVSADGSIVVGNASDGTSAFSTPFIWDASNGMRNLKSLLENEGLDLAGWELRVTTGVSDDGTVISGWGVNPAGNTEGWVAQIDFVDTDGDGVPDSADACPLDPLNDADGDGFCGDMDNCPEDGGDQTDFDGDGLGDVCDVCPSDATNDADDDGICGSVDNCPLTPNSDQLDTDSDGEGDRCDTDDDNDSFSDEADNCPLQANDQTDSDGDGAGDVCDSDADADGVIDAEDACLLSPIGETVNAGGCAVADLCPCSHDGEGEMWKNHKAYVKCVKRATREFKRADLITKKERNALRKAARQSSCGRKNND